MVNGVSILRMPANIIRRNRIKLNPNNITSLYHEQLILICPESNSEQIWMKLSTKYHENSSLPPYRWSCNPAILDRGHSTPLGHYQWAQENRNNSISMSLLLWYRKNPNVSFYSIFDWIYVYVYVFPIAQGVIFGVLTKIKVYPGVDTQWVSLHRDNLVKGLSSTYSRLLNYSADPLGNDLNIPGTWITWAGQT